MRPQDLIGTIHESNDFVFSTGRYEPRSYLITDYLGEGAERVVLEGHPLDEPSHKLAIKFGRDAAVFHMRTLHHSFRIDAATHPDHPLLMAPEQRLHELTSEMLEMAASERLLLRVPMFVEALDKAIEKILAEYQRRLTLDPDAGPPWDMRPISLFLDQSLVDRLNDLLDEDRIAEDHRAAAESLCSQLTSDQPPRLLTFSHNHLVNLVGLAAMHFISPTELLQIGRSQQCRAATSRHHLEGLRELTAVMYYHLIGQADGRLDTSHIDDEAEAYRVLTWAMDRQPVTSSVSAIAESTVSACELLEELAVDFPQALIWIAGARWLRGQATRTLPSKQWEADLLVLSSLEVQVPNVPDEVLAVAAKIRGGQSLPVANRRAIHRIARTVTAVRFSRMPAPRTVADTEVPLMKLVRTGTPPRARQRRLHRAATTLYPLLGDRPLTEAAVAPAKFPAFAGGMALANVHRSGAVHGDLHPKQLLFEPETGMVTFVDVTPFDWRTDVDPGRMAREFMIAAVGAADDVDWLHGLLSGYVHAGNILLEDAYPSFIEDFLHHLGLDSAPLSPPKPDPGWRERYLSDALSLRGGSVTVNMVEPTLLDEASAIEIAFTMAGLVIAGLDCVSLIPWLQTSTDSRWIANRISQHYGFTGLDDSHRPPAHHATRLFFEAVASLPVPEQGSVAITPWYAPLAALRKSAAPQDSIVELVESIVAVTDWLAARVDRTGTSDWHLASSIRLAQFSLVVRQDLAGSAVEMEAQDTTTLLRHRELSWYARLLRPEPSPTAEPQLLTYALSRNALCHRMFTQSVAAFREDSSQRPLWSAHWRNMYWSTRTLRNLAEAAGQPKDLVAEPLYQHAYRQSLSSLAAALREGTFAAISVLGPHLLIPELSPDGPYLKMLEEFHELADLSQGGAELDDRVRYVTERGSRATDILTRRSSGALDHWIAIERSEQ